MYHVKLKLVPLQGHWSEFMCYSSLVPRLHHVYMASSTVTSKIGSTLEISPPPFLNKDVAKGAFLSKVRLPIYATVHAVMLSKKHRRSSTVQEKGLTNEGRHHLLLLHNQAHNKRGIAESLHVYITRAGLTACEVGIYSITTLKNMPTPFFVELLKFIIGVFSRLQYNLCDTENNLWQFGSGTETSVTVYKAPSEHPTCLCMELVFQKQNGRIWASWILGQASKSTAQVRTTNIEHRHIVVLKYEVPWWLTCIGRTSWEDDRREGRGKDKDEREGGSIRRGDQEVGNKLAIIVKTLEVENVMSVAVWVHPVFSMYYTVSSCTLPLDPLV